MRTLLWATCAALSVGLAFSLCEGDSCAEQTTEATSSGLLGSSLRNSRALATQCPFPTRTFSYDIIKSSVANLDSEVYSIEWSGADDEWVWVITLGTADGPGPHQLWLSQDKGKTFVNKSPALVNAIRDYKAAKNLTWVDKTDPLHSSVSAVYAYPGNPRKVLLWADGYYNFVSEDGGATFKAIPGPPNTYGTAHDIRLHPTKPDWLLSLALRKECYGFDRSALCTQDLFYSPDFGVTWQNLTAMSKFSGFTDCDWGWHAGEVNYTNMFAETTILATGHQGTLDSHTANAGELFQLYRTDDFFKSSQMLANCGNAFELVAGQVFFARSDMCSVDVNGKPRFVDINRDNGHVTLYASMDGRTFNEVCLPTELKDKSYVMISAHDGRSTFILGDHDAGVNPVCNLYANANITEMYTLTLRNVYFGFRRGSYADVTAITPIPGRFIANQELSSDPLRPYVIQKDDFNTVANTLITHNSGASWQRISVRPDAINSNACRGACTNPNDCYLHLHGQSSWIRGSWGRPAVYASPSAPGIVMATGNLGPASQGLLLDKDKLCTWLSVDGGVTWRDVADDLYIYEYFNHGNGIVMAKFREEAAAKEVLVSLDRGQCWYHINITEDDSTLMYVDNIRVEPDGAARIFHVMGSVIRPNSIGDNVRKAVIITIDMADVLSRPDSSGMRSDVPTCDPLTAIEDWTPVDSTNSPQCILGSYRRIKRRGMNQAPCLLAKDYVRGTLPLSSCQCTLDDLYCEYGYEKDPQDYTKCISLVLGYAPTCPAVAAGRYTISQSRMCLPRHASCPNMAKLLPGSDGKGQSSEQKWAGQDLGHESEGEHVWVVLFVLAGIAASVGAFVKFAPDHWKDKAMYVVEPVIGAGVWAFDAARGLFNRITKRDHRDMGFERLQASNQAEDGLYAAP